MQHPLPPGLDREEPDLWIEDDIPTPAADEAEDEERAQARESHQG
jgi:hypothetical protein